VAIAQRIKALGVLLAVLATMTMIAATVVGLVTIPAISSGGAIAAWVRLGLAIAAGVWVVSRRASEPE